MTEDEAKTKWCPMARVGSSSSGNGALNKDWARGPVAASMCIASECMMWRWHLRSLPRDYPHQPPMVETSKTEGYCGLAGAP